MSDDIRVHVVKYPDRKNYMLRYIDPMTGKHVAKSAGTSNERKALEAAGKWQAELREGRYQKPNRMTWDMFRQQFEANVCTSVSKGTATNYLATFNKLERTCKPKLLAEMTTARITRFTAALREQGLAEASIARHLRSMKVAMRWAHRHGLLLKLPQFDMPKRAKGAKVMRGRPITGEEFDRMIKAIPKVVENAAAKSWEFYLRGLWESGLRLSESLLLRWDDAPGAIVVDFSHKRPMLRIPAEAQKSGRDTLLPMTPEFAKLLDESVPEWERRGRVFKVLAADATMLPSTRRAIGPIVSEIGKAAGVIVDERTKGKETVKKFASAHDLRRAFGQRWAAKVMPSVLRELMRHSDISTTMKFYVGTNAEATADLLWAAAGNTQGNTPSTGETDDSKNPLNSSGDDRS